MPAHQALSLTGYILRRVIERQPLGLTKFRLWANQNTGIYEETLEF